MLRIGICDDEEIMLEEIQKNLEKTLVEKKIFSLTSTFSNAQNLLYEIKDGKYFDLLLLDIDMPDISGMDLARQIHGLLPDTLIIFVTAHYKYAIDSYELNIFRYIPKNQLQERLPHAIQDAAAIIQIQNTDTYIINSQNHFERIPIKDILYIERDCKNAVFHISTKTDTLRIRKTLAEVYSELNPDEFQYIERGYIVNLQHISGITNTDCILTDQTNLPIAQSRLTDVKKKLNEFWRNKV